jgi:hypothetical protein
MDMIELQTIFFFKPSLSAESQGFTVPPMRNFEELINIWEILHKVFVPKQMIMHNSSYGHPWTISKIKFLKYLSNFQA